MCNVTFGFVTRSIVNKRCLLITLVSKVRLCCVCVRRAASFVW
jgi:hypothetical protein